MLVEVEKLCLSPAADAAVAFARLLRHIAEVQEQLCVAIEAVCVANSRRPSQMAESMTLLQQRRRGDGESYGIAVPHRVCVICDTCDAAFHLCTSSFQGRCSLSLTILHTYTQPPRFVHNTRGASQGQVCMHSLVIQTYVENHS